MRDLCVEHGGCDEGLDGRREVGNKLMRVQYREMMELQHRSDLVLDAMLMEQVRSRQMLLLFPSLLCFCCCC